ncbi:MAG TPA: c-type cytochrome [Acidimicrobiales bacterium]|nr:c-type cytochrome [Acidimicrobiales bacterium]
MTLLLAATTLERVGFFVALGSVVAWAVWVVVSGRQRTPDASPGAEIELAPNRRPYLNDESLEGPRLERALGWGLLGLIACAVVPLAYWLNEPARQAGAIADFDAKAVERGRQLFLPTDSPEHGAHFGCATCHGSAGQGGSTEYSLTDYLGATRKVTWEAPPVDTALLKFSKDEVRTILVYGRANTPMPPWGVEGGGPMNAQQIDDLVAYLDSITISPERARQRAFTDALNQARSGGGAADPLNPAAAIDGAALFKTNCARCHTKGWSYGEPEVMAGGAFGPSLLGGATLRQFPDVEKMVEFITLGSEFGKPYGERGQGGDEGGGMPGFGDVLTPAQIRAIVDYERGLQ